MLLTGRVNGKRNRWRQRLTYLESLSKLMTEQVDEREKLEVPRRKILRATKDRELWKSIVANFLRENGQREREREREREERERERERERES